MLKLERKGGERVGPGTYWNTSNGERVRLEKSGILPGEPSDAYLRFHPLFLLIVGPLLGLVYAIFLPLAATLMVIYQLSAKLSGGLLYNFQKAAAFGWRPSEAYLAGRKKPESSTLNPQGEETRAEVPPRSAAGDQNSEK